jgi:hypothetical protein
MFDATGIATAATIVALPELQHEGPIRGQNNFIFEGIDHGLGFPMEIAGISSRHLT